MDVKLAGGMCPESQARPSPRCRCTELCSPADAHVDTFVFTHACTHTCTLLLPFFSGQSRA